MNVLSDALRQVASDLDRRKLRWALVGGFAVSARAEPRFTRDIDVAVAVSDDADSEDLVRLLLGDGRVGLGHEYDLLSADPQPDRLADPCGEQDGPGQYFLMRSP